MQARRVVTGHTADGKATITSDTKVEEITVDIAPGFEFHRLWGADETVTFPDDGSPRTYSAYFPPVGGFRFGLFTVPPGSETIPEDIDFKKALAEMEEKLPGMAAHMEPDAPGMHTTDTIDFEYVISGEVWLELDDGKEVHLRAGDTVVQNGTRHAWRNKSSEPCCMVVCIIGAHRI
jgi:mannose-6-phosphate isomerase-like protein (cupin superfamily)